MTKTILLLRQCIKISNPVTRSVLKTIVAKRMKCSPDFIQMTYLKDYGLTTNHTD